MSNTNFNAVQAIVNRLELVARDSFMLVRVANELGLLVHPVLLSDVNHSGAGLFISSTSPAFNVSNKFAQSVQNEDAYKSVFSINSTVIRSHVLALLSLSVAVSGNQNTVSALPVQDVYVEPNHQHAADYIRSNFDDLIETARVLTSSMLIPFGYDEQLQHSELVFEGPAARNITKLNAAIDSVAAVNVTIAKMIDDTTATDVQSDLRAPHVRAEEPRSLNVTLDIDPNSEELKAGLDSLKDRMENAEPEAKQATGRVQKRLEAPLKVRAPTSENAKILANATGLAPLWFGNVEKAMNEIEGQTRRDAMEILDKLYINHLSHVSSNSKMSTKQVLGHIRKTLKALI